MKHLNRGKTIIAKFKGNLCGIGVKEWKLGGFEPERMRKAIQKKGEASDAFKERVLDGESEGNSTQHHSFTFRLTNAPISEYKGKPEL